MTRYIGYCRVSTDRQGIHGLGMEAQQAIIRARMRPDDRLFAPIHIEVESGRMRARPVLRAALDRARLMKATLVVAKLDRLARDAAFVAELQAAGAEVLFCDMPEAGGAVGAFMLGMLAQVAQLEAGLISERTKAALAVKRAQGMPLGGARPGHPGFRLEDQRAGGRTSGAVAVAQADAAARAAAATLAELRVAGATSNRALARALNAAGMTGPHGGTWTGGSVRNALKRLDRLGVPV